MAAAELFAWQHAGFAHNSLNGSGTLQGLVRGHLGNWGTSEMTLAEQPVSAEADSRSADGDISIILYMSNVQLVSS